jgi:hypothetical protein
MSRVDQHIEEIGEVIADWLKPDNRDLKNAIDQTVDENLFSFEDIKHQILHLRKSLTDENLKKWARLSNLKYKALSDKTVLCLHAGNLPLVGLQDSAGCGSYRGKLLWKSFKKRPLSDPNTTAFDKTEKLSEEC